MNILIMHETVTTHDAVGNDIEAMFNILSKDHEVYVFANTKGNKKLNYVKDDDLHSVITDPNTVIIYHHSVYWEKGYEVLKRAKCNIIFRYHNITPPSFFNAYSPILKEMCEKGRLQTDTLMREFPDSYWISDSEFNARDLYLLPKDHIKILPPFNKLEEWGRTEPDQTVLSELEGSDTLNLLFVGRIVPNKGYLMLFDVLYQYCNQYGGKVKLRVVGKESIPPYSLMLDSKLREFGLLDKVEYIGEVTDKTLAAYYKGSDYLVCCSAHEGFCVPIVEAQYFGLPVIAMRYSAVPETLGKDQITLGFDSADFAAAIHVLEEHPAYREHLIQKGHENYNNRFSYSALEKQLIGCFREITRAYRHGQEPAEEEDTQAPLRIAFVSPWYAEKIPGGAEMELRSVSRHLKDAGVDVEILTTQVKQFASDWNLDYYPEGTEYINGIPVTRFPVRDRNAAEFNRVNTKLMMNETISEEEEEIFCREMINSSALYEYIRSHRSNYDFFVFIPYMFGTTFYGLQECYERAVMIPCFHDESYVYLNCFKKEFSKAAGMVFNASPEAELAEKVYELKNTKKIVMGIGMDTDLKYSREDFREKFKIEDPFLLYAGRKDAGKGVGELISYYCRYKEKHQTPLKLVLIGGGKIDVPEKYRDEVLDLGFVDIQDKYNAYGSALALCQLSKHESFSFVIMESWLCDRPVIVHKECAVTSDFVAKTEGGYSIGSYEEFEKAVDQLAADPAKCAEMAARGHAYVQANFNWDVITKKYCEFFRELKAENRPVEVDIEKIIQTFKSEIDANR